METIKIRTDYPYIYLNYSGVNQGALGSYGRANVKLIKTCLASTIQRVSSRISSREDGSLNL